MYSVYETMYICLNEWCERFVCGGELFNIGGELVILFGFYKKRSNLIVSSIKICVYMLYVYVLPNWYGFGVHTKREEMDKKDNQREERERERREGSDDYLL